MNSALVRPDPQALAERAAELEALSRRADAHEESARASSTRKLYESDWRRFAAWCDQLGATAMPASPEVLRLYITDMAAIIKPDGSYAFGPSTIARHMSSIAARHRDGGFPEPTRDSRVRLVIAGIRNDRGVRPRRMRPLLIADVRLMLTSMDHTTWPNALISARDRLAILAGFAGAFRRSEIAAVQVGHVTLHHEDGLHVFLPKSKTDQSGKGAVIALPFGRKPETCAPCAWADWSLLLNAWQTGGRPAAMGLVLDPPTPASDGHLCRTALHLALLPEAPLLRAVRKGGHIGEGAITAPTLREAVIRRAVDAGLDPTDIGFHSLRAGFVTQARRNGADARSVRRQTRHSSDAMVDLYDREYNPLEGNAVTMLGL